MPTKTEIATRIMRRIAALDTAENPTAQEANDVIAVMDGAFETEKELGRFPFLITDMPTRYQEWFVVYAGWFVQPHFGLQTISPDEFIFADKKLKALDASVPDTRRTPVVDY